MGAAVCFVLYVGRSLHYTFYILHYCQSRQDTV